MSRRTVLAVAMLICACGGSAGTGGSPSQTPVGAVSPGASAPASSPPKASSSPSAAATPSASAAPSPAAAELVIADYATNQVRLARLDATDTATVTGTFDGVVSGHVIVVNGLLLESLTPPNTLKKLGTLAGAPEWNGVGTVAVKPDLSQWLYTVTDTNWTSHIHLGTATTDQVVATVASPDGNAFYNAYGWSSSGAYFVREATGLGGAGPFLEYHFPLARLDLSTGHLSELSPACVAFALLVDGGVLCRPAAGGGQLEVRTQSGLTLTIQVTTGTANNTSSAYWHVYVSPDNAKVVVTRNGATDPAINYQMAVAGLTDTTAKAFGPLDYVADTWLPDGRIVADHQCVIAEWGGGPCNTALDGAYIFSADGATRTLFFKLKSGFIAASV